MNDLTDLQKEVFEEAKRRLEHKSWYRGICTDLFKPQEDFGSDEKIREAGFETAVLAVCDDTAYWDYHYS